jgi:hypothetical protein
MVYIRPFLSISQTTLTDPRTGERYPFKGLFTSAPLPRGSFLGFYNGEYMEGGYRGKKNSYTMSTSLGVFVPKVVRGKVDGRKYPLAMINEPAVGEQANVVIAEFHKAKGVVPQLHPKQSIDAIGFYTSEDVPAGRELFAHCGYAFGRAGYQVGTRGRPLRVSERETPQDMARAFHFQHFTVPEDCFEEYED